MNFLETLGYGGTVTGIGLCVVFVGLAILIGAIVILSKAIRSLDKKANAPKAIEQAPEPTPIEAPVAIEEAAVAGDELIAVIAAAIAALDGYSKPLVIRSVRRVSGWKQAARAEQVFKY